MPSTSLDTADFVELAELLQFPGAWLAADHAQLVAVPPVPTEARVPASKSLLAGRTSSMWSGR